VRVPLPEPLLGEAYWEAYRAAQADYVAGRQVVRSDIGADRTKAGSVGHAFVLYTGSASFKNGLATSTQSVHFNILSRWRDQWGDRQLRQLQRRHVVDWLNERVDTPAAAKVFPKVLRRMMQHCISIDLIEVDPTAGVRAPRYRSDGIHTWTDGEIEQYQKHDPIGSNARLALELMLGTAQRKSDIVRMGRQHVRGDVIYVKQEKTGWEGDIPIVQELGAALAAVRQNHLTFLVTAWGEPYTAAASATISAAGSTRLACRSNVRATACARR
jgi:integrase